MRHAPIVALAAAFAIALPACSNAPSHASPDAGSVVTGPLGTRADLPVDERLTLENLSAPVDIVRDKFGRPHIYAATIADAMRAEGYLVAKDRHLQLEFFRRISEGRMAEILAASDITTIDLDITYRHIGLGRVAQKQYDALPKGDLRDMMDAFADGVTQLFRKIRSRDIPLPDGIFGIDPAAFTDWSAVDSLAIGRLQTHLLSYDADVDLSFQRFFDAAHGTFAASDPDPLVAKRAGLERDLMRFAPSDPATTSTGYPMLMKPASGKLPPGVILEPKGTPAPKATRPDIGAITEGYQRAMRHSRSLLNPDGFGSNNWAITPSRSATGHPLVASDPHLSLIAPSIFWPVSIDVKGTDAATHLAVGGIAFPGIPGIILGHNEHIAWGATVAGYDVSDAYAETLSADGASVTFNGKAVAVETIDEIINIQGRAPYTYHVKYVPHHGPILPDIRPDHTVAAPDAKKGAISIRWTGLEATNEIGAVFDLLRATDVDAAREALKQFGVGAQNWMIGDTSGNVLWTSHAKVPIRDPRAFKWNATTYQGQLPCMVLPGDGTAEWKGYLDDDLVPWAKNPAAGFISSANNDPTGDSLDNDPSNDKLPDGTPMYLACTYDIGFREGRIQKRIKDHPAALSPEDMASIQADVRSVMGAALAPGLIDAIDRAEEERTKPGMHPDLTAVVNDKAYQPAKAKATRDLLVAWGKDADYRASAGIDLDTNLALPTSGATATEASAAQTTLIFNAWLVRFIGRVFDDEIGRMKGASLGSEEKSKALLRLVSADPVTLATYDAATQDSSLWDDIDTPAVESRRERMIHALNDAFTLLETMAGPDLATYRWGEHHTITFGALIALFGKLSIPPVGDATFPNGFPRSGDWYSIDASSFGYVGLKGTPDFSYNTGPTQRFVADMDPSGPKVWNALPGGNVWDATSPHFRDEAELWRRNQTHAVPFLLADVIAAKESRIVAAP